MEVVPFPLVVLVEVAVVLIRLVEERLVVQSEVLLV